MQAEAIYKGATRPAMELGIPLVPLVVLFGTGMLLIMWGGTLVSWWIALGVLVAFVPALLWMRFVTSKDDQRFRQMFVAAKMTLPVEREVQAAVQGQRGLAAFLPTRFETQHIQIFDDKNQAHQVELPTSALRLLVDILAELADGNAVKVVPVHAELTTQEAADMLNVSRPHLVKLLEEGGLPFHKTGKHRRVRLADLMQFKSHQDQASEDAMAELAKQAQELALGYE